MTNDLDDALNASYHKLFRGRACDCGDGWFCIIDQLARRMTAHAEAVGLDIEVVDAKEKHGRLSIDVRGADEAVLRMIEEAEVLSERTCDVCGASGKLIENGWQRVRCADHTET